MSSQNISSFGHHFRRLDMLNSNYITDPEFLVNERKQFISSVIQPPALFSSDQASLLQFSKNWGREERRDREDNHTLAYTR